MAPAASPSLLKSHSAVQPGNTARARNIHLMYGHVFLFTIYQSICQWNLFDAYLSLLAKEKGFINTNTWVGFAEGIMGITTLVLVIPLGFIVDSYDRVVLLKVTGAVGVVASIISAYALSQDHLATLYANLCLWGIFIGLQETAAEAVFADSTDKGTRSRKFTTKSMLTTAGLSFGPLMMIFLFLYLGDEWTLNQMHVPLLIGCCFGPLCCIPLFFMQSPNPEPTFNGNEQLSTIHKPFLQSPLNTPLLSPATSMLRRDRIGSHCSDLSVGKNRCNIPPFLSEQSCDGFEAPTRATSEFLEDRRFKRMTRGERLIPYVLTTGDFVMSIGAGMTVRFFPLFFINDYRVTPIGLSSIFCLTTLCAAVGFPVCQKLSVVFGRAQASVVFKVVGICALVLMTCVSNLPFLIVVFVLRASFQNAPYPVDQSILNDYIPSKHRGKWNSIASLSTMTWSGSAVLGGFLVDRHDYKFTFLITAGIYVVGLLCYTPLLWWVPRSETDSSTVSTPIRNPATVVHRSPRLSVVDRVEESPALTDTIGTSFSTSFSLQQKISPTSSIGLFNDKGMLLHVIDERLHEELHCGLIDKEKPE